jgi:hypothetical protein
LGVDREPLHAVGDHGIAVSMRMRVASQGPLKDVATPRREIGIPIALLQVRDEGLVVADLEADYVLDVQAVGEVQEAGALGADAAAREAVEA